MVPALAVIIVLGVVVFEFAQRRQRLARRTQVSPIENGARTPTQRDQTASPDAANVEVLDHLERLSALHNAGHLTDEEFAAQKARLLVEGTGRPSHKT